MGLGQEEGLSPLTAEIISVGEELLRGETIDTNAAEVAQELARHAILCPRRITVGDKRTLLAGQIKAALERADVVFALGGLGPTDDDLTRDAAAEALGVNLVQDPELVQGLRVRIDPKRWSENQLRQAMRPQESDPIANANGTAPGLICRHGQKRLILLPGPPREMLPMLHGAVRELLAELSPVKVARKTLRFAGIGEAALTEQIKDLMSDGNPSVAPYVGIGEVKIRVSASAETDEEAEAMVEPVVAELKEQAGEFLFWEGEESLAEIALKLLKDAGQTIAAAESLTGGLIGGEITSAPGSSAAFRGSIAAYTRKAKADLLGVNTAKLVSEECAKQMAEGARKRFGTDWAISATGEAGPTAEEGEVGEVWIGLAGPDVSRAERHVFKGSREKVRDRAVSAALIALIRALSPTG